MSTDSAARSMTNTDNDQDKRIFAMVLGMSLLWTLLPFVIAAIGFMQRRSGSKIYDSVKLQDLVSSPFGLDALAFVGALLMLHLLLAWAVTRFACSSRYWWRGRDIRWLLALLTWLAAVAWFHLHSSLHLPRSRAAFTSQEVLLAWQGDWAYYLLSAALLVALLITLLIPLKRFLAGPGTPAWRIVRPPLLVGGLIVTSILYSAASVTTPVNTQPNVIFIGVDSLRVDQVSQRQALMPTVSAFLADSARFTDATTPLARTYPSWMSVLTGQYPVNSGARYNLIDPNRVEPGRTLAAELQRQGYTTLLGMDERRFANFDESYGFEHVVGPKAGVGDFVLGAINDTPISNALLHTRVGEWLFPYSFVNRAATRLYDPAGFDDHLGDRIRSLDADEPLFMIAHFCLPHWPYTWAESSRSVDGDRVDLRMARHQDSLRRTDEQFANLIDVLRDTGRLDNALVVVMSDHGESHGDIAGKLPDTINSSIANVVTSLMTRPDWGHGTNVTQDAQYQILLAMRGYGGVTLDAGEYAVPVATVDLAPTVMDVLKIDTDHLASDGQSLLPVLHEHSDAALADRPLFMESGFSVPAIISASPDMTAVAAQGFEHYRINPDNARLEVKPLSHDWILAGKQRGVRRGDWQLVTVNDPHSGEKAFGLRHRPTGEWTDDLDSPLARNAPLAQMMADLRSHYGPELDR